VAVIERIGLKAKSLEPVLSGAADPSSFFLEHARVALTGGNEFGAPGKGFARINFATSRTILLEILERMERAVHRRSSIG
jgi:cystathionine beta-lyase